MVPPVPENERRVSGTLREIIDPRAESNPSLSNSLSGAKRHSPPSGTDPEAVKSQLRRSISPETAVGGLGPRRKAPDEAMIATATADKAIAPV